jgi:methyl-accepting chemotaxis protein
MLNQLAPLMTQVAQIATDTAQTVARHDQTLIRIEEQTRQNSEVIGRLEQRMDQLADLVTTSTTETIRLVADNSRQIANNNQRIEQILEYLYSQSGNGNGRNGG